MHPQMTLCRQSTPAKTTWNPKVYSGIILEPAAIKRYQQMIGMCIWLITLGRVDIHFPIAILNKFSAVATKEHYKDLIRVFKYLNKYPNKYIPVRDEEIKLEIPDKAQVWIIEDMKKYYPDSDGEWDEKYPVPLGDPVTITTFVDADHAADLYNRRSHTRGFIFLGATLFKSICKQQKQVTKSTYGAEFTALLHALEDTIETIHMLCSIGVAVNLPARILCDNLGVVDNATVPGSTLKKKQVCITYHRARECIAAKLIVVYHIDGKTNVTDINTKVISRADFTGHLDHLLGSNGITWSHTPDDNMSEDIEKE